MTRTRLEIFKESSGGKRNVSRAIYRVDLPMGMSLERTHGDIELTAAQDERRKNTHAQTVPGQTFADVFACAPGAVLNVSVEAESTMTVMFLHIRRWHSQRIAESRLSKRHNSRMLTI